MPVHKEETIRLLEKRGYGMQLKIRTNYAIRVILVLAKHQKKTSIELAEILSIETASLTIILKTLKQANLLSVTQGVKGGYRLNKNPADVTMLDIINVMEPINIMHQSIYKNDDAINHVFSQLQKRIETEFSKTSIAELAICMKTCY